MTIAASRKIFARGEREMNRTRISKRPYTYKGETEDRWLVLWSDLKGTRREKWFQNKHHAEAFATKIDRELADLIHRRRWRDHYLRQRVRGLAEA